MSFHSDITPLTPAPTPTPTLSPPATETLVKSQDSPDSNKHYSCSKRLVDFCKQKTKGTDPFTMRNIYLWDEQ